MSLRILGAFNYLLGALLDAGVSDLVFCSVVLENFVSSPLEDTGSLGVDRLLRYLCIREP